MWMDIRRLCSRFPGKILMGCQATSRRMTFIAHNNLKNKGLQLYKSQESLSTQSNPVLLHLLDWIFLFIGERTIGAGKAMTALWLTQLLLFVCFAFSQRVFRRQTWCRLMVVWQITLPLSFVEFPNEPGNLPSFGADGFSHHPSLYRKAKTYWRVGGNA